MELRDPIMINPEQNELKYKKKNFKIKSILSKNEGKLNETIIQNKKRLRCLIAR